MLRGVLRRGLATYKTSTGLVGLRVDPQGRETLLTVSSQVLNAVQKIPTSSEYRTHVEQWFQFIHKSATTIEDLKKLENDIGLGQVEEVIEMAKTELELIDYYYGMLIYSA